jgi:hypothetical protein
MMVNFSYCQDFYYLFFLNVLILNFLILNFLILNFLILNFLILNVLILNHFYFILNLTRVTFLRKFNPYNDSQTILLTNFD